MVLSMVSASIGCSFSYSSNSISDSISGSSDTLKSSSESSSDSSESSSGGDDGDETEQPESKLDAETYAEDVTQLAFTYAKQGGDIGAFRASVSELAARRGLTNWEVDESTSQSIGKGVGQAGMSEEDALKLITINPAKLLHLDDRMGSIKVGKDGDVVLWNDHPLSIYAKPLNTIIDGTVYFDI